MTSANDAPRSETGHFDGHVITVECFLHTDTNRWEPVVLVKPAWSAGDAVRVATTAEHFQDTPHDALSVAKDLARKWIADNDPSDGTVDAAV